MLDGVRLDNGRLIGADYISFYLAGKEFSNGNLELAYDWEESKKSQQAFYEQHDVKEGFLPFIYPPLVLVLFSWFAGESYLDSFLAWTSFSLILSVFSLILISSSFTRSNSGAWLESKVFAIMLFFSLAFFPFSLECLGAGQTSVLGLFIFSAVYFLLKKEKDFLAGLVLSLSYYKPPLFLTFVFFALFRRQWRMVFGFGLGGALLIFLTLYIFGLQGFMDYIAQATGYRYGESLAGNSLPTDKGVGLLAALTQLLPSKSQLLQLFTLALSLGVCACLRKSSKQAYSLINRNRDQEFDLQFALEVSLSLLLSIQMVVYDLTIMILPLAIICNYANHYRVLLLFMVGVLSLEFTYRNVEFLGLNLKLTTVTFSVICLVLFWELRKLRLKKLNP